MKFMVTFLILNIVLAVLNMYVGNTALGSFNALAAGVIGYMVYDLRKDIKNRERRAAELCSYFAVDSDGRRKTK